MTAYLPKIVITGGQGQLAKAIQFHVLANQFDLKFVSHTELDITQAIKLNEAFAQYKPDLIINTAAYTAVDKAEAERETALQVNHLGVKNLAIACEKYQVPLIHLSTDYVFDGSKNSAYQEIDATNPINFYGHSKQLGEQVIEQYLDNYIILRVSSVFSEYGHNFVKTILRLAQEKNELRIVEDQ